ncbi:hypothetical protein [Clostridium brassicae]|uniref:DUF624 domain-containing protein n=1 Tax=Clostridium brassicae TaxID=2999072 RepID=A0ABT4D749_9CLOT|nr:hypothetical protein [Clostridium brassicae]MCY6958013.1 hypothetical protein [Clostridium brassicae]
MLVDNIFPKVNYPDDKKSIEHIIKEYDKVLKYKLKGRLSKTEKPGYIIQFFSIAFVPYIITCSWISLGIRVLYVIPLIFSVIYNIVLFKKVKDSDFEDEKIFYKFENSNIFLLIAFIYGGIFGFQTVLFGKWNNKEYLICFIILALFSLITFMKVRIESPKKFIKQYLYTDNKMPSYSTIIIPIVQLLVSIAYFKKPYFFILILSYIFLVVFSGFVTYGYFEYLQYDKIQELKKQINYIPKEK